MYFTGTWIYRGKDGEVKIDNVNDLFALNKEQVVLWAVCELDYQALIGTYVVEYGDRIIIIGEGNTITYKTKWGDYAEGTFEVVPYSMCFALNILDFGYTIEAMWLQDYYKLREDQVYIFTSRIEGSELFCSIEEFEQFAQNYQTIEIMDFYGNPQEEITLGNIYYVRLIDAKN
jgi:hypothetical protein